MAFQKIETAVVLAATGAASASAKFLLSPSLMRKRSIVDWHRETEGIEALNTEAATREEEGKKAAQRKSISQ